MLIPVFMLSIMLISMPAPLTAMSNHDLIIVSTFPEIAIEIKRLLCQGDDVLSLIPMGIDPHEYQLRPNDIDLLEKADLIVSTGHTGFEHRLRELVEKGEIRAILIDLMEIPGLTLLINPVTNTPNPHLPIRDPLNYMLFVINISETLSKLNPGKSECYISNMLTVIKELSTHILPYKGTFKGNVVIDRPPLQYLVEWMGFKTTWIVKPEEGIEPTPYHVQELERLFSSNKVLLAITTYPATSSESRVLRELAERYNVPLISIDMGNEEGLIGILKDLVSNISEMGIGNITMTIQGAGQCPFKPVDHFTTSLTLLLGVIIGVTISMIPSLLGRRRK
ncbi:MAG: zinc ABC transporter substrate-binding protein [Desulfurococcaceae archaeon]